MTAINGGSIQVFTHQHGWQDLAPEPDRKPPATLGSASMLHHADMFTPQPTQAGPETVRSCAAEPTAVGDSSWQLVRDKRTPARIRVLEPKAQDAVSPPTTFFSLVRRYFRLLQDDPVPRKLLTTQVFSGSGDSLIMGGAMAMTAMLGSANPLYITIGYSITQLIATLAFSIPFISGTLVADEHAQRVGKDNPDIADRKNEAARQRLLQSCNYDLAAAGMLLLAIAGASLTGGGQAIGLAAMAGIRLAQAWGKGLEVSSFKQLRWVCGTLDTKQLHQKFRESITSLEIMFVSIASAVVGMVPITGMWVLTSFWPAAIPMMGIGFVTVGVVAAILPKIWITRQVDSRDIFYDALETLPTPEG